MGSTCRGTAPQSAASTAALVLAPAGVHGCMVANAHPELREWCEASMHDRIFRATRNGPGGIVEALHHFRSAVSFYVFLP